MKKLLLVSLSVFALTSGAALAADIARKAPLVAPPPPSANWTGCYVDGGAGYGLWQQNHFIETFPGLAQVGVAQDSGGRGWLGRFGGGCDYQFSLGTLGNFVIGALADYDIMSLKGFVGDAAVGVGGESKESSAWGVGGRFGYLVTPSLLTYVGGGYSQTRFDQVNLVTIGTGAPLGLILPAHTFNGGFLSTGLEYALNFLPIPGLFVRTEYRYASYRAADLPIPGTGAAEHIKPSVQTITTALVWRFSWAGR
jgi:outer membrane immunogenic protein